MVAIADRLIGVDQPPFLIAEMSGNHNQSLDSALKIIDAAIDAGADAVKLQTYTADTMTLKMSGGNFDVTSSSSIWSGSNLYQLYDAAHTPWEWHEKIFEYARDKGIICFSSPFDSSAIDLLEGLGTPAYKIASFENNHLPLIERAAATGKPLIISTGMASISELFQAVETAYKAGCSQLILLKCTSSYPALPLDTNLKTIPHLKAMFGSEVGLSDHTLGLGVAVASIALGATVIEKHFTLSRSDGGVDSQFSLEPAEFKSLVHEANRAWQGLGSIHYGPTSAETDNSKYRRSIYVSADIQVGETFTEQNLRIVRPGDGISPSFIYAILGKRARKPFKAGQPLTLDDLLA